MLRRSAHTSMTTIVPYHTSIIASSFLDYYSLLCTLNGFDNERDPMILSERSAMKVSARASAHWNDW